jgi:hypothetical protein
MKTRELSLPHMAATALLALLAACGRQPATGDATSFSEERYRAHVERLSSDVFEGRGPGTAGEKKTVAYIEQEFRAAGLEPGIGDSFVQAVPAIEIRTTPDPMIPVQGTRGTIELRNGDDFVVWTRRPVPESRITDAGLVFAGYGIVAPEYGWDDYAGLDARGKVVMVLVNDPGYATQDPSLFTGTAMTYYGRWTYKFEEAVRQGAAGVLVIHETAPAGYPWDVPRNGAGHHSSTSASLTTRRSALHSRGGSRTKRPCACSNSQARTMLRSGKLPRSADSRPGRSG